MKSLVLTCALVASVIPTPLSAEEPPASGPKSSNPMRTRFFDPKPLARGVYGLRAISSRGAYCNGGFAVAENHLVLVDSFARPAAARDAARIIRSVTSRPVTHLVLTHHHFDHVGGTKAFGNKTKLVAHRKVAAHLKRYNPTGSRMPDQVFQHGHSLPSRTNPIYLLHMGRGHTDADTFVYLPRSGVLFTGDMVVNRDAGFFGQARVLEWIWTLKLLSILPIRTVVPGHGPIGDRSVLTRFIRYLTHMYDSVNRLVGLGLSDRAVLRRFRLAPPYNSWANARSRTRTAVRRILRELRRAQKKTGGRR